MFHVKQGDCPVLGLIHLTQTRKKGIGALQIFRMMGFGSHKAGWHLCHRVRGVLADQAFQKLMGVVEVDETLVGGKLYNKHGKDKDHDRNGPEGEGKGKNKSIVAGPVRRKGGAVARVINNVGAHVLTRFVKETVSTDVSLLIIDNANGYKFLKSSDPQHETINQRRKQYGVGAVHTNTIEGFWSLIKRGMVSTYHKVPKKCLPLYVAEFQFRYNNRENADIVGDAVRGC